VDILFRDTSTNNAVWFMNGTSYVGDCQIQPTLDSPPLWAVGAVKDFNRDGKTDIAWGHPSGANAIWIMDAIGYVTSVVLPSNLDTNWKMEGAGDFNGDGKPDILWHHHVTGQVAVWYLSDTSYVSSALLPAVTDLNWHIGAVADFNRDGQTDIAWRHSSSGQNSIWIMNGITILSTINAPQLPTEPDISWKMGGAADANGDGYPDLYWRHESAGENAVWFLNGGVFSTSTLLRPEYNLSWKMKGVGNFTAFDITTSFETDIDAAFHHAGPPPDVAGVVGPSHFISLLNNDAGISVYNRANPPQLLTRMLLDDFFQFPDASRPRGGAFDPRIINDPGSQRWIACALERKDANGNSLNNELLLAVSTSSDPIGTTTPGNVPAGWHTNRWTKYRLTVHETDRFTDFPMLSVDAHGVYIGLNYYLSPDSSLAGSDVVAISKQLLVNGQTFAVQKLLSSAYYHPQVAMNFASLGIFDPAWAVAGVGGGTYCASITWDSFGVSATEALNWTGVATPAISISLWAPQPITPRRLDTAKQQSALESTVLSGGYLWASHTIAVNSSGLSTNPDRDGCEWLKFTLPPNAQSPISLADSGRVYDRDATTQTPWYYFMSSLMANSRQDVLMSFSGSSAGSGNYLSAFFAGRYQGSPTAVMCSPIMIGQGYGYLTDTDPARVGDYSTTSLDPNDQLTFWTIDEICDGSGSNTPWATWAAAIQVH
jgi:hypothetical protein